MIHRTRIALLAAGLLLAAHPTYAQDVALEDAKGHFDEGQNLYLQGKYLEAAAEFHRAYEVKRFPAFLFNVAVCYEKSSDFAKSLQFYERYLQEDPHSPDKALVKKRMAAIKQHLNPPAPATQPAAASQPVVVPKPPPLPPVKTKGLVVIESKPEGAAIYLNDKTQGIFTRTPYTGSLPPGRHTVILELRKYKPERKTFTVRHDRMTYLYFALSAEEYLGWIEVKANVPGADVFFDAKEVGAVGRTPYTGFLRPGTRKVIVERPGYATHTQELEVTAGKDHVVNVELKQVSYGWLKITGKTTKGAAVLIDGKPARCESYPCRLELPRGSYQVTLEREDYKRYRQQVEIAQASETQLAVRLHPKPSRIKAYISFGVAAAMIAGGITTGVMSNNRKDALETDLKIGRLFDSSDPRISEGRYLAIGANSLFVLSGVTGVLGLYYLLRNEGPDSYGESRTNKLAITPAIGPNSAGISGQVRF